MSPALKVGHELRHSRIFEKHQGWHKQRPVFVLTLTPGQTKLGPDDAGNDHLGHPRWDTA